VQAQAALAHNINTSPAVQLHTRPNRTGLPDHLKSGIEALSGISMDNVKVHYNSSKPAQLNALAYAQGADIHVGPGQEQHLPHEAWHVVQQAQRRVRPTMLKKEGGAVNDDRARETEADVIGKSVAAHGANREHKLRSMGPPAQPLGGAVPVTQRKLGFEFETGNLILGGEVKDRIFEDADLRVEGDTESDWGESKAHNVEFVITECDRVEQTEERIGKAVNIANALNALSRGEDSFSTRRAGEATFKREVEFVVNDSEWTATPQVTAGVLLSQMGSYLEEAYARAQSHQGRLQTEGLRGKYERKASPGFEATEETKAEDGLIILIATYLLELGNWRPTDDSTEGPKNALVAMSRTDFRSMVRSLNFGDSKKARLQARVKRAAEEKRGRLDEPVIPREMPVVYTDETVMQRNGTTIAQWIDSIFEHEHKIHIGTSEDKPAMVEADEMSPPELFRGVSPRYSMGAMGMDNNLVLLEERASQLLGGNATKDQWADFASQMFDAEHARFIAAGGEENAEGDVVPAAEPAEQEPGEGGEEDLTPEEREAEERYQRYAKELGEERS
jgi:hypothetical protein